MRRRREGQGERPEMFIRGDGSMVSLQDASRRLQVPVDTLWRWITEGRLAAEVRPGRGLGMEYYLDPGEMKRAQGLREREIGPPLEDFEEPSESAPSNVISLDFSDLGSPEPPPARPATTAIPRRDSVVALENLRAEALGAVERQTGREAAIGELVAAVEALMNTMLEAMDRAQDLNEGHLTAELEALRVRLSRQIQDREREDLRLRDEL